MVPGYTLTTFSNVACATTAATKVEARATTIDNKQQQNTVHSQPEIGTVHYHPVHTAAILSSAHCSYTIWCQYHTVHPVYL